VTTDDELIAIRCQLGERDAFDALIARWHIPLWTYARRVAGSPDAADDIVQDVWMRVVRGLPRLKDAAKIRAWIFGIARRVLMDRFREHYATPIHDEVRPEHLAAAVEIEEGTDTADEVARMQTLLAELPIIERDVLALFYLQELPMQEISELLSVPVGTVKSRLHRARRRLRDRMEPGGVR
jgi:RNA polymerase sigma-70 factor (ECF subfamily)